MKIKIVLKNLNLENMEKQLCYEALSSAGNITDAAKLLGIDRQALSRRIKKHKINW